VGPSHLLVFHCYALCIQGFPCFSDHIHFLCEDDVQYSILKVR